MAKNGYFDKKKDYSLALQDPNLSSAERSKLETERQNKIDTVYGGNEPTMAGSNKTYSQAYSANAGDSNVNDILSMVGGRMYYDNGGKSVTNMGKSWDQGVDYSALAALGAQNGDWAAVDDALRRRNDKMAATGATGNNITSMEIWKALNDQYGGPSAGKTLEDMNRGAMSAYGTQTPGMGVLQQATANGLSIGGNASTRDLYQKLFGMNYTDWTNGSEYAALANRYRQAGRNAMQDTLGQVSARTGGLASSYAQNVANQSYNGYMEKLEEVARAMYDSERQEALTNAQLAQEMDNIAYNRERDNISDQRYADELSYKRNQDELSQQQAMAQTLAQYGDFSGYKALGYTDAQVKLMQSAYQQQLAAAAAKKSSGSGGGSKKPTMTLAQAQNAIDNEQVTDAVIRAYDYYMGEGSYEKFYGDGDSGVDIMSVDPSNIVNMVAGKEGSTNTVSLGGRDARYTDSQIVQKVQSGELKLVPTANGKYRLERG